MSFIFTNSENGKTSDSHRVNLLGKTTLKRSDKCLALSNLSIYYKWKNIKKSCKIKKSKYHLERGMINSNYLMDHILHQIFKIVLSISKKTEDTE